MKKSRAFLGGVLALSTLAVVTASTVLPRDAVAQGAADRQPFQQVLLVPPDDKDYVITRIPDGFRAVVTDVVAYNALNGKGHRVSEQSQSYVWVGGYLDGKAVGLVNRMRLLGNQTEQWHMITGFELKGAKELVVSSDKEATAASPALVYVTGYLTR